MPPKIETGFYWDRIKAKIESSDWEDTYDGDSQMRGLFLGTVLALYPSGKYYLPFACSNVDACPECKGAGSHPAHPKRRIVKKWYAASKARRRRIDRMRAQGADEDKTVRPYFMRTKYQPLTRECKFCNGVGSREAYLDELYREKLEAEAAEVGLSIENGEGDPCDVFACEYRDRPEAEESDDSTDSTVDEQRQDDNEQAEDAYKARSE